MLFSAGKAVGYRLILSSVWHKDDSCNSDLPIPQTSKKKALNKVRFYSLKECGLNAKYLYPDLKSFFYIFH